MRRNTSRTTINPMSFASLLSDLKTATGVATGGSTGGDTERNASNGGANASQPSTSDEVDPTSKVDPSFTPSVVKECIERMLRVQQMRRSFAASTASSSVGGECAGGASDGRRNAHIAVCATIVDAFPHEAIWKRWMASGGELGFRGRAGGFTSSAELYVHAKNPERVRSAWLR